MVDVRDDDRGIRHIVLREHALEPAGVDALVHALKVPDEVRCVLLSGGPEVFCSGASEDLIRSLRDGSLQPTELLLPRDVLDVPVPVVGAAEGHAVGGGLALLACCDIAFIARESRYGATFVDLGFTPGMGCTALLEHFLPPALAWELLLTGQRLTGAELAPHWPHVLPRAEVLPRAQELCWSLADKPRSVVGLLKQTLSGSRRAAFEGARTTEALMHRLTFGRTP